MNIISLTSIRRWLSKAERPARTDIRALDDVYVTRVVESLNYCKTHPESSKCENLFV